MAYKEIDQVTADCLENNDLIVITDSESEIEVWVYVDDVTDDMEYVRVLGHGVDDEEEYYGYLYPDDKVILYMEVDDD